jgi:poly(A) polymerase
MNVSESQRIIPGLWQSHRQSQPLRRLHQAVTAVGGDIRIVGGAVRDTIAGRSVGDIDLACTLPPDKLMAVLAIADIKTVPTGIAHGTITAIIDHRPYEITTLRCDHDADGRHARVVFTDDWQADAARRDFTFNAMYAAADGTLYDYFNGQSDLVAGRVRFIGDATARIREDVLRILRFYRFQAWYGVGEPDATSLAACAELAPLLPTLSAQRVWRELTKLVVAPDPVPVWQLMMANHALVDILPEALNTERLQAVIALEAIHHIAPSFLRRIAALLPDNAATASLIGKRLKLANRDSETLTHLAGMTRFAALDLSSLRALLYIHGAEPMRDALLINAAAGASLDLDALLPVVAAWAHPVFPLRGNDIIALGVGPGPVMGAVLRAVEDWWIGHDFQPTHDQCVDEAKLRIALAK